MLILLPPSEGKAAARRGKPLDLSTLDFADLTAPRERVLDALVELCEGDPDVAAKTLGIGTTQLDRVELNRGLRTAPTARADQVYTGVVYDALDFATLSSGAKRRANTRVAVTSSLFGLVRPADRIPSYRLSGDTTLPGLGPVAGVWREHLGAVVTEAVGSGLLVDLRSGTYVNFWRPAGVRSATVRVLHEHNGQRKVVSHFNKATKGRIVRALLEAGADPRTPATLAAVLRDLDWVVEEDGSQLDVVVSEL
ncbi:peroxide stress protein YaaA [Nocardioides sp. SR21]|uniref:peroxide stress protein YaaA n=1 Tax=Nocardioides sp. SR21 TaxID=2919501 RepID=UPI001FA9478C|nr:peroxide stress protein YaaA [Nocardioides sp. SR21]